jgi:CheY-specific phosphatase CheX
MSQPTQTFDVRQFLTGHLVDVFDTMLSMKAAPVADGQPPHFAERVTGSVGFAGENVNGAVYLHLSAEFATTIASTMLGIGPEDGLGENEINDVIGECTNMLAGGMKSALCDAGSPCAVSTPGIIRGAFEIEASPEVRREVLLFDSGGHIVTVEVHIKFN